MNEDQLEDLKQFVANAVGQSEERIRTDLRGDIHELRTELKSEIRELRTEVRDGFAGVADAVNTIHDQLDDHERRIINLDQQAA